MASEIVTEEMVRRAIDAMSNRLGYVDSCYVRDALLAVAPLIRRAALEEAAKVAKRQRGGGEADNPHDSGWQNACDAIESAIRALATQEPGR